MVIMFRHMVLYGTVNIGDVPAVDSMLLTRDCPTSRHTIVAPFPFLCPHWQVHVFMLPFLSWLCPCVSLASLLPPSKAPLHNNFTMSSFHIGILLSLGTLLMPHHGQLGFCSPFRVTGICIQSVCSFFVSPHSLSIHIPVPPSYKHLIYYVQPCLGHLHFTLQCSVHQTVVGSLWHWTQIASW